MSPKNEVIDTMQPNKKQMYTSRTLFIPLLVNRLHICKKNPTQNPIHIQQLVNSLVVSDKLATHVLGWRKMYEYLRMNVIPIPAITIQIISILVKQ